MFDAILRKVVGNTDGALGALIMGLDGIPVARSDGAATDSTEIDIDVIAAEYTALLRKSIRTAEDGELGALRELVVASERYAYLVTPITDEYFLLLVLRSHTGVGRARFELKKAQLLLEEEFSV